MGKQTHLDWIAQGSQWRLMTPAADLRAVLRAHGYVVGALGNVEHLEAPTPEDHTPYSATGWPGKALYGTVYALDIMPPTSGAKSKVDGLPLPTLQQLGAQILADRNSGVASIKWLKYMNWEPERDWGGACWYESWQPGYTRRTSTDRGHIHMSGLTGFETSTIGAGYDPVAQIRGDSMTKDDIRAAMLDALRTPVPYGNNGSAKRLTAAGWNAQQSVLSVLAYGMEHFADARVLDALAAAKLRDEAILAAVAGAGTDRILARIDQVASEQAARDEVASLERAELAVLVERGMAGELAADDVVRLIGERLAVAPRG